jgi:hypothetical protein
MYANNLTLLGLAILSAICKDENGIGSQNQLLLSECIDRNYGNIFANLSLYFDTDVIE